MVEANGQSEKEKKALNRAVEIAMFALKNVELKFQQRQFYLDMYHSFDETLKSKQWWQSKFVHAFPFFTTEMKASFYYEGVFGTNNTGLWSVQPWDELSINSAEVTSKLLKHQLDKSNFLKEFYTGSKGLGIYGDWFLELGWDRKERVVQLRPDFKLGFDGELTRPDLGGDDIEMAKTLGQRKLGITAGDPKYKKVIDKNQPDAQTLHINSVWPDPKASCLEDARYICVRREIPFDKLKQMEKDYGMYKNVDKLKGTTMPKLPSYYYDHNDHDFNGNNKNFTRTQSTRSPIDQENNLVEIIDILYPQTGEWESIGNRCVYMGRTMRFRNITNPLVHIKNFEENSKFFGTSDYKPVVKPWQTINRLQNHEIENVMFHHRGYTFLQRDAGEGVREQFENLRPGSVIVGNNIGAANHSRPDLFSPIVSETRRELINEAQLPMGLNEILSGATPSSNVRSSSQFAQLANFGAKILSQGIRNISQGLKEVGEKWVSINYELLDTEETIPVLGFRGQEMIRVNPGDIPVTANVSVRLSADLEAQKEQKLQQMLQAINMAQSVPGFATARAVKEWFRSQGRFEDPDRLFLLTDEESEELVRSQFAQPDQGPANIPQEPGLAGSVQPPDPSQVAQGNSNAGIPSIPGL